MTGAKHPPDPSVSIIIATYQRRACVGDAIQSALAQPAAPPLEVIVVDDGSSDGSAQAVRERFSSDRRVVLLEQPHAGVAAARNLGLARARGRYVTFLDSDDVFLPGAIAAQLNALRAHPKAQAVLGEAQVDYGPPRGLEPLSSDPGYQPGDSLEAMFEGGWSMLPCWLIEAEVAKALSFRTCYAIASDTEFQFRFFSAGHRCARHEECLVHVRRDGVRRGAPRLSEDALARAAARLKMMREHRRHAPDGATYRRVASHLTRRLAKELSAAGRHREARPHLLALALARPWRLRTWARLARNALSRGQEPTA